MTWQVGCIREGSINSLSGTDYAAHMENNNKLNSWIENERLSQFSIHMQMVEGYKTQT
jgi:hypothetical protein